MQPDDRSHMRDRAPLPTKPADGPDDGDEDQGPRRPKVERPNTDDLLRRMRRVDPNQARRYRQRTGGPRALWSLAALLAGSCAFSVAPTSDEDRQLTISLSAFPERISIDTTGATSEVWATVRQGTGPVRDSTVVFFATTVGEITQESFTRDGLAVAVLTSPGDGRPRRAVVVAQAITVRDTLDIDFVTFDG